MLSDIANRLDNLAEALDTFAMESMLENEGRIMELQRQQLFEGKDSEGKDIRPYYSEDLQVNGGYFKSPASARRYAAFKAGMTYPVQAVRNSDAPNLYINGRFHSELGVEFNGQGIVIKGKTPYADEIVAKYGLDTFGLSPDSLEEMKPLLVQEISKKIKNFING